MKKKIYIAAITIVTVLCIVLGSIHHMGGMDEGGFFGFFSGGSKENIIKDVDLDKYSSIDINAEIMDIEIVKGDSFKLHYECNKEKLIPTYSVENGKLTLKQKNSNGINWFSFSGNKCKAVLTIPSETALSDVNILTNTGDISISDTTTEIIKLESDTGDVKVYNSNIGNTTMDTDTGDILVEGSTTSDVIITSDTGDIRIKNTDMAGVNIETDTGDISIAGGIKVAAYSMTMDTDTGDVSINGNDQGKKYTASATESDSHSMKITTDTGDITISE